MTTQETNAVKAAVGATTWLEAHKRSVFLVALFIVVFLTARFTIRHVNDSDYIVITSGIRAYWSGQSPYTVGGYFLPPWDILLLSPLVIQPVEAWLALDVAIFTVIIMDLGSPSGLLLLLHPIFITVIVSANPEWLIIGTGLWCLYRAPKGWGRGLAWLLLASKPQSTFLLLLPDGIDALTGRDWKAIALSACVAAVSWILVPGFLSTNYLKAVAQNETFYSTTVIYHYGPIVALFVAGIVVAIRWRRLKDLKTLGLILSPVLSPYMLQYGLMILLFTMRKAGLLRNVVYVVAGIILVFLFWQDYHVSEHVAILGMTLLTAILAPVYLRDRRATTPEKPPAIEQTA